MDTPLLATDGDNAILSAGPEIVEESEFSRLIAQCSSNPLNDHFEVDQQHEMAAGAPSVLLGLPGAATAIMNGDNNRNHHHNDYVDNNKEILLYPRGPWITALAGTLSLMHLGFIWSSYMADVWTECHLRISVNWQHDFLPFLNDVTDTVIIRSTNLASLLQQLDASRQIFLLLSLWIISLLLPCAFMILSPTFIVADYKQPVNLLQRSRSWTARGIFEVSMRWAWMTGHLLILLSMSTSFLELHWTDTKIQVGNRFTGSMAAYMLGITAAVGFAVLLRVPSTEDDKDRLQRHHAQTTMAQSYQRLQSQDGGLQMLRSPPPPHAFQHSSLPSLQIPQNNNTSQHVDDHDDEPHMTVLEEEPSPTPPSPAANSNTQQQDQPQLHRSPSTPDLISEESVVMEMDSSTRMTTTPLTFWQKFTAFQLGLLSVVFWIPALYLPMLVVSYSGVAMEFLTKSSLRVFVWEIPSTLWQQGRLMNDGAATTTPVWILLVLGALLLLTLLVLPVLATCLGILTWLGEGKWSTTSQAWLYAIYPALGGVVFSVTLVATVPPHALEPLLGAIVWDQEKLGGICSALENLTGEACLEVHGRLLPGAWFYLAQSIVLEFFVTCTLRWC